MNKFLYLLFVICCVFRGNAQSIDIELYDRLYEHRNRNLDGAAGIMSATAYPVIVAVPLAQAFYGLGTGDHKQVEYALQTATGLIFNAAATYTLKHTIDRKRPYITHPGYIPLESDTSPSFPSGHTSFSFAVATSLSIQYKKWYFVTPAYLWATGVAYSRIHRGAHYPGDVLAGAIIGAGASYLSYTGNQWLRKKWNNKTKQTFLD